MRNTTKPVLFWLIIALLALNAGCGETEFSGGAGRGSKAKAKARASDGDRPVSSRTDSGNTVTDANDGASSTTAESERNDATISPEEPVEGDPQTVDEILPLPAECWFAVSGTWIMPGGSYASTFPRGKNGGAPTNGESFDGAGGVYLAPREQPYVYGQGGKEIDAAIRQTFDGIAIPPGVSATIRSAAGVVLVEKQGPWLAQATFYSGQPKFAHKMMDGLKAAAATLPSWVNDFLAQRENVDSADLYQAQEVLVRAVPGGACDRQPSN